MLEDEGRIIGSNNLPLPLFNGMQQAPVAVIDDPFDIRPARLQAEYIDGMREQFEQAYGVEEGWRQYDDYLHHGLFAIRRRLGPERFQQLTQRLEAALRAQRLSGGATRTANGWRLCCSSTTIRCIAISWKSPADRLPWELCRSKRILDDVQPEKR